MSFFVQGVFQEEMNVFQEIRKKSAGAMYRNHSVRRITASTLPHYEKKNVYDAVSDIEAVEKARQNAMEWGGHWPAEAAGWIETKMKSVQKLMDSGEDKKNALEYLRTAHAELILACYQNDANQVISLENFL